MADDEPDYAQWIAVMATLLDLPTPEPYRPGISANLKTAAKMAALLEAVELEDDAEAAPVYRA